MRKSEYFANVMICSECNGLGLVENSYGFYYFEDEDGECQCPNCKGTGYVIEERDEYTGYRIFGEDDL